MSNAPTVYGYHAHVYYDDAMLPVAEKLKEELGARFDVELGPNSGERVGPHPIPQFQMIFKNQQFQTVVPWRTEAERRTRTSRWSATFLSPRFWPSMSVTR
jgi:aromatic ring-cleaving dioxygenase